MGLNVHFIKTKTILFYFDKLFGKDYKSNKKKNPTDTIYYTAWLLALTRGSEGMRKGQALKKQPRYIENWG